MSARRDEYTALPVTDENKQPAGWTVFKFPAFGAPEPVAHCTGLFDDQRADLRARAMQREADRQAGTEPERRLP
jgi:hypothetical protein